MRLLLPCTLLAAAFLPVQGCDETDIVAIRIQLSADGSGTVTTSSLSLPPQGGAVESAMQGVSWKSRAAVTCTTGSFADVSKLKIEDMVFSFGSAPDGTSFFRVTMPRGPDVQWAKVMTPTSSADRKKATEAFDVAGSAKKAGSSIKLQVDLPKPVLAHGIHPRARGATESVEEKRGEVVLGIDTVLTAGDPLVWQLTWQK